MDGSRLRRFSELSSVSGAPTRSAERSSDSTADASRARQRVSQRSGAARDSRLKRSATRARGYRPLVVARSPARGRRARNNTYASRS
eukprot:1188632-Prorocentrum_minimum.AAC.1